MFGSLMFSGVEYNGWIKSLIGNRAVDKNASKCLRCGFCCAARPCIPTPTELQDIAKFLKLSLKKMVKKYFVGDRLGGTSENIIFPAKRTQTDITGTFINANRTYDKGYCIFFDESKKVCLINSVKPAHGKSSYCWKDDEMTTESILKKWNNIDIEKLGIDMTNSE